MPVVVPAGEGVDSREIVKERKSEEKVSDPNRPQPEVLNAKISRGMRWTGEKMRGVVAPSPTRGATWVIGQSYVCSVSI